MEILQGAENKNQQKMLSKQMNEFRVIHLEKEDTMLAQKWFEQFYLSHGFGLMDSFIASTTKRLNKPLYTFNIKHFKIIKEIEVKIPYQRDKK